MQVDLINNGYNCISPKEMGVFGFPNVQIKPSNILELCPWMLIKSVELDVFGFPNVQFDGL